MIEEAGTASIQRGNCRKQDENRRFAELGGDGRYFVVRGSEATTDDFESVIALDRETLDPDYFVSAEQDRDLFLGNRENGLIVKERQSGEVVGYAMILPVREDVYARIRAGTFVDTALTPDMILAFDHPGVYRIYFASVVIHPAHRGLSLLFKMVDAMIADFVALAERDIYGKTLTADAVSSEGERLAQLLGLTEVCRTDHGSRIYEATALPPAFRAVTPMMDRLIALYRARHRSRPISS